MIYKHNIYYIRREYTWYDVYTLYIYIYIYIYIYYITLYILHIIKRVILKLLFFRYNGY